MNNVPERIWAARGLYTVLQDNRFPPPVPYIRLDLHEAEVARLTAERDRAITLVEKAQWRRIELADRLGALRRAADALAQFVEEFAAAHIRPLPIPHVRHPADEPDQVVDAETVWAWQSDAAVALAAYRGKGE